MSTLAEFQKHFPDLIWDLTPDQIKERAQTRIQKSKSVVDRVLTLPADQINFKNVLEPLAFDDGHLDRDMNVTQLLLSVSPDSAVRDAANQAIKLFSDFGVEIGMRKDLFDLLNSVRERETNLPSESERYLTKLLLYKRRNGLHLSIEKRDRLEALFKEISNFCIDFSRNITEEDVKMEFTREQLKGMSDDYLTSLEKSGDLFVVTQKYPDVVPLLQDCQVRETRRIVEKAFNSRCLKSNVPILEKVIKLRHESCELLGYPSHVDYVTEILMSKSAQRVHEFLVSLASKLRPSSEKEMARLLELKREECEKMGESFDGKIYPFDFSYYQRKVEERDFCVDHNVLKEYFPFEFVIEKMMDIYQSLLHLSFSKVEGAKTWHPEVTLHFVSDSDSGKPLGYFYLDLFPRPGKYTHAACFGIEAAYKAEHGRQLGCAAMVANFTKPLPNKPSLLTHQEVVTLFHEFGHVMHQTCSATEFAFFHGTSVERDFVEAPSQMLENWAWEPESLKQLTCHYQTKESLSDDLISKLIKSKVANIALRYTRQIVLSIFDYTIHTCSQADTFEIYKRCYKEYLKMEPTPGTNFSAAFGHMCGGYDAQYYGYLWSDVFACDMFVSRFKKEGIFNPTTGLSYRKCILHPGSTKDGTDMLKEFLGREPIQEPFLERAGLLSSA